MLKLFIDMNKSTLVSEQKVVHRDGKTFLQTFHVNPDENRADQQGKRLLLDEFDGAAKDKSKRADVMKFAKLEGITWSEHEHEGINWMRASMAIKKYLQQGNKEVKQLVINDLPSKIDGKSSVEEKTKTVAQTQTQDEHKEITPLSKDELTQLNNMMLHRGAPDEKDDTGYNQPDFLVGRNIMVVVTDSQAAAVANMLVKYSKTQLGIPSDKLKTTQQHYQNLVNSKTGIVHDVDYVESSGFWYIAGDTFPAKVLISQSGGRWDSGAWKFYKPNFTEEDMKNIVEAVKHGKIYKKPQEDAKVSASTTTSSSVVHDVRLKEISGMWAIVGNTYPAKDLIKQSGGWYGRDGVREWTFDKHKYSREKMESIVEAIRGGKAYAATSNNSTSEATGKRGSFTGLDYRISLSDVKEGEYGKIIPTRGRKLEGGQQKLNPVVSQHLRPHQLDGSNLGIAAIDAYGGFLLSDGTGAGKTIQELAISDHYASKGEKVLIVVPNRGIIHTAFTGDSKILGIQDKVYEVDNANGMLKKGKINLITYTSLSKLKDHPDYIIFDEAQSLKNVGESARSEKGMALADSAKGVVYASATPIDKAQHLQYLKGLGIFSTNSFSKIMYKLGYMYEEKTVGSRRVGEWKRQGGVSIEKAAESIDALFSELADMGLTVKREVSMDKVTVKFQTVNLPTEAHEELDKIADFYGDNPENKAIMLMAQRRFQEPYKLDAVNKLIDDRIKSGRKVVVFATRVNESEIKDKNDDARESMVSDSTIRQLCDSLSQKNIKVAKIFGDATVDKEVAKFQNGDCDVAVVTPEKGGAGLSLDDTTGDKPRTMIVMTPPFSAVDNVQMAGRVNRLNTKSNSELVYITADTDVDFWNTQIITEKMKTLHAAVQGNIGKLVKSVKYLDMLNGNTYIGLQGVIE